MFDPDSRYADLPDRVYVDAEGNQVRYRAARVVPRGRDLPTLAEVPVAPGERLDLLASRTLGRETHFWRLLDAADAVRPDELDLAPGTPVTVPSPQGTSS